MGVGCCINDIHDPGNDPDGMVELGLCSTLSTAAGLKMPFINLGRQTSPISIKCSHVALVR